MRNKLVLTAAALGGVLLVGCGSHPSAAQSTRKAAALASEHAQIVGTWVVTVTPSTPGGPFQSTIAFTSSGAVIEATSKPFTAPTTDTSEGLGVWETDGDSVHMTFQKYRFSSTGTYIGRTVVVETETLRGENAYTGHAVTTVYNPSGNVLMSFSSTSSAVRMTN